MKATSSRQRFLARIKEFAQSSGPGAILVTGQWGVGKTHAVQEALKPTSSDIKTPFSYISLFGVSSHQEAYSRLLPGCINKYAGNSPDWLAQNLKSLRRKFGRSLREIGNIFNGWGDKGTLVSSALSNMLINKMLVIIDDLERRGSELSLEHALGMVSALVEEKQCRVIFITDESQLPPEDKQKLARFKEKAFDFEVFYCPTIEENLAIMSGKFQAILETPAHAAKMNNLRVIRRCRRVLEILESKTPPNCKRVKDAILTLAANAGIAYYGFRDVIQLEHLQKSTQIKLGNIFDELEELEGKQCITPDVKNILRAVDYQNGPWDSYIFEVLESGDAAWEDYEKMCHAAESNFLRFEVNSALKQKINEVLLNYSVTDEKVIADICKYCSDKLLLLDFDILLWASNFLTDFDQPVNRDAWIKLWADHRIPKMTIEELQGVLDLPRPPPAYVADLIQNEIAKRAPTKSPEELILSFIEGDIYYHDQLKALSKQPESFYKKWLSTSTSDNIRQIVRHCFQAFYGKQTELGPITDKILAAVNALSSESPVNASRGEYYKKALKQNSTSPNSPSATSS